MLEATAMLEEKGQLSLEFLIILAAFFSILLLVLPFLIQAYDLAELGLNRKTAEIFLSEVKGKTSQLNLLSDGSCFELKVTPIQPWEIEFDNNNLKVFFVNQTIDPLSVELMTGEFELRDLNDSFISSLEVSEATVFELRKEKGIVVLDKT
jgi:uncharacterized protein (UPF0333 family)